MLFLNIFRAYIEKHANIFFFDMIFFNNLLVHLLQVFGSQTQLIILFF